MQRDSSSRDSISLLCSYAPKQRAVRMTMTVVSSAYCRIVTGGYGISLPPRADVVVEAPAP